MADIHGKLAGSLAQVQTKFGDQVGLELSTNAIPRKTYSILAGSI